MKHFVLAFCLFPLIGHTDTLYHCKAYSGGTFWSSTTCSHHKALIDRTASVPANMPFDKQVEIAEGQRQQVIADAQPVPLPSHQRCNQLSIELNAIESRYNKGQWQPLEVINPDQKRTRGIRAEQRSLGCSMQ